MCGAFHRWFLYLVVISSLSFLLMIFSDYMGLLERKK
jgi:hypothetical protein